MRARRRVTGEVMRWDDWKSRREALCSVFFQVGSIRIFILRNPLDWIIALIPNFLDYGYHVTVLFFHEF